MAAKQTPKIHSYKKQYTRKEVLESLIYELKPFVIAASGFAGAIYFSKSAEVYAKYSSVTLMACGLIILYARAKDRGVIR